MSDEFWRTLPATIAAIGAIVAALISFANGRKITAVHTDVNGKLEELVAAKEKVAFSAGGVHERARATTEAADLAAGVAQEREKVKP